MAALTRDSDSTFRDYFDVLRRRRWIVLAIAILAPVAAYVIASREQRLYQGSADVLLTRQNIASSLTGLPDPNASQTDPARFAQTQASLATVPELAQQVARSARLRDQSGSNLLNNLTVTPNPNADILTFKVADHDRALASRLTTAYARQFTVYRQQLDDLALNRAKADVDQQLARLQATGQKSSPLYGSLLARQRQITTLESLQNSSAVLVRPSGAAPQIQPAPAKSAAIGLGVGLLLGIVLAFLAEALDTRVRDADEVGEALGMPLLARIGPPDRKLQRNDGLTMLADPTGSAAEAYRVLRTNFEFVDLGSEARTVMVTSAIQAEGKSTTCANLAIAMARSGKRVLLVDLDLRRPYQHRFFRIDPQPGITDVALRRVSADDAVARIALSTRAAEGSNGNGNGHNRHVSGMLEVLPTGPQPPDPGDFVNGHRLDSILEELTDGVDLVLIDSPPLLQVGDPLALSAKVDAMILVAQVGVLRRGMLKELQETLSKVPCRKLGFVLAGVADEDRMRDGYYVRPRRERMREGVPTRDERA